MKRTLRKRTKTGVASETQREARCTFRAEKGYLHVAECRQEI